MRKTEKERLLSLVGWYARIRNEHSGAPKTERGVSVDVLEHTKPQKTVRSEKHCNSELLQLIV